MGGTGTYALQAGPNLSHEFTATPSYVQQDNARSVNVCDINTVLGSAQAKFEAQPVQFDL